MTQPRIFLANPTYDGTMSVGTSTGIRLCSRRYAVGTFPYQSSLMDRGLNILWSEALAQRDAGQATHFAMIHTDICPLVEDTRAPWLLTLWKRLYSGPNGARLYNVASVTAPIKSNGGLSSTGLDTSRWNPRRLTMTEIMRLPDVLDNQMLLCGERFAPEIPLTGISGPLLINTGLWLADIRGAWADHICFETANRIYRDAKGVRSAEFEPEDWRFSRDLYRLGVPYCAVKDVHLNHMGPQAWINYQAWGLWETDRHDKLVPDAPYTERARTLAKSAEEALNLNAFDPGVPSGN